jgi:AAA domain/Bifunctional DNA primase/polymerase, N-terminal
MSDPAAYRRRLLVTGYSPLPLVGKVPILKNWQKHDGVSDLEIDTWSKRYPLAVNTGILTRLVPALDLDLLDPEAAAAVEALAKDWFDEGGYLPVRFGRFPKRALLFRCDQPFAKITVPLIAPDGSQGQRLEFLADGQQLAVDGLHPDTGQPYGWHGGIPGEIKREDLAYLHEEQAHALFAAARDLLISDFGYRRADQAKAKAKKAGNGVIIDEPADWAIDFADHDALAALSMKLLKSGMRDGAAVNFLRAGVGEVANIEDDRRARRLKEVPSMVASARAKLDDEQREAGEGEAASSNNQLEKLTPIRFVRGEVLPPREWIAYDGWIPTRKVTLLQGDGGEGKTPLVHQLQASCATALPWLGLRVEECASIGFYSEDEEQDIKERQAAIDASYGCACVETGNMHLFPRVGEDNELVVFDRNRRPSVTKFYRQVCEAAYDYHARLVVLDVAVDLFGGNEISRVEVRAFFRPLFLLARNINGAVVMTSHVSQAGIRSDGGHSGSTDWSNAARTRLYLSRPKDDDNGEADANARILTRKKANLASIGDTIKLHWKNGLIVPDEPSTPHYFHRSADEVFLALLDAVTNEGQRVSPKPRAGNYAPMLFMKRPPKERGDYQRPDFERAMQRLLQSRDLTIVPYGRPS